jgi:hypothetical protein
MPRSLTVPSLTGPNEGIPKHSRIDGGKGNYNISVTRKIPEKRDISTLFYVEPVEIFNIDE